MDQKNKVASMACRTATSLYGWGMSVRIKPLVLGQGPVFLSIALAMGQADLKSSEFNWLLNTAVVVCVLLIQVATHFFNDSLDFLKGADSVHRQGPRRAVQEGLMAPSKLIKAGFVCLFLAGLIGIYLVKVGGWPIFLVGFLSLFLAYFYTGGPWPLAYKGLADPFVLLFFGLLPSSLVFYLNTGYFSLGAGLLGLQCGFLALSILVLNNLRDEEVDRKAQKKTLVVRFGQSFGLWEWRGALWLPYLMGAWWLLKGPITAGLWPLLLLPLSLYMERLLNQSLNKVRLFSRVFFLALLHYSLFLLLLSLSF